MKRKNESDADLAKRVAEQNADFDKIRSLEGFRVREGHLSTGAKRQQKEVNVLLSLDMMKHSFNKNMSKAVLISGDRDFKPVVEAVSDQGTIVHVCFEPKTGSAELAKSADAFS